MIIIFMVQNKPVIASAVHHAGIKYFFRLDVINAAEKFQHILLSGAIHFIFTLFHFLSLSLCRHRCYHLNATRTEAANEEQTSLLLVS